jgi:hypothetical protein
MMEQIEIELKKLNNKTAFAREASKKFNRQASSIINHWIGGLAVPKSEQKDFYKFLVTYNAKQNGAN